MNSCTLELRARLEAAFDRIADDKTPFSKRPAQGSGNMRGCLIDQSVKDGDTQLYIVYEPVFETEMWICIDLVVRPQPEAA